MSITTELVGVGKGNTLFKMFAAIMGFCELMCVCWVRQKREIKFVVAYAVVVRGYILTRVLN